VTGFGGYPTGTQGNQSYGGQQPYRPQQQYQSYGAQQQYRPQQQYQSYGSQQQYQPHSAPQPSRPQQRSLPLHQQQLHEGNGVDYKNWDDERDHGSKSANDPFPNYAPNGYNGLFGYDPRKEYNEQNLSSQSGSSGSGSSGSSEIETVRNSTGTCTVLSPACNVPHSNSRLGRSCSIPRQ
ncbi:hypothetical protein DACRYDRAFT_111844, partial [Dacryopinax primogenitus]